MLLILATLADNAQPLRMSGLLEALSQLIELTDQALDEVAAHDAALPRFPHCSSCQTRFLGEYPRFGVPYRPRAGNLKHRLRHRAPRFSYKKSAAS